MNKNKEKKNPHNGSGCCPFLQCFSSFVVLCCALHFSQFAHLLLPFVCVVCGVCVSFVIRPRSVSSLQLVNQFVLHNIKMCIHSDNFKHHSPYTLAGSGTGIITNTHASCRKAYVQKCCLLLLMMTPARIRSEVI